MNRFDKFCTWLAVLPWAALALSPAATTPAPALTVPPLETRMRDTVSQAAVGDCQAITHDNGSRPWQVLVGGAMASALIYWLVFVRPFPLSQYYNTIPPVDYAKLTHHSVTGVLAFTAGIAALGIIYVLILRCLADSRRAHIRSNPKAQRDLWLILLLATTLICGLLVTAYPTAAIDVLIYAVRTRGWAVYGLNPLATAPQSLPADAWAGLAAEWANAPSPYGPLWEGLSRLAFHAAGGRFLQHVLFLKAIAAAAHLAAAALVALVLRRLSPDRALLGAAAFALNPVLLLESAGNGHNDILVALFMLLAVWLGLSPGTGGLSQNGRDLAARGQWLLLPTLTLAALVKITPVLVLPFFVLHLLRCRQTWGKRLVLLAVNLGLSAAIGAAAVLPLWPGWDNWAVRDLTGGAGRSPFAMLVLLLRPWLGANTAFDATRIALMGAFLLVYAWLLWTAFRAGDNPRCTWLLPSAAAMFWYLLLPNQQYHAWYLLWPFTFAVLLIPHPLFDRLVILGLTSWLAVPLYETLRVWWWDALPPTLIHAIAVPLVFGIPFLFHLGLDAVRQPQ